MMQRKGFTLVELVVVILILGILAGVAAPKMFSTSAKASESSLRHSLTVIRDAIELYHSDNGAYPPCNSTGSDFKTNIKPYLRGPFPNCGVGPAAADNTIVGQANGSLVPDAAPTAAYRYRVDTGEFICNYNAISATQAPLKFSDF